MINLEYLSDAEREKLKKQWQDLVGVSPDQTLGDGLLEELFANQDRSLKDSLQRVSDAVAQRKFLAQSQAHRLESRISEIKVALGQFPFGTCYPHLEARRSHLERQLDALLHDRHGDEVAYWSDLHRLYKELIYLTYKDQTLRAVRRAVGARDP